MWAKMFLNTLRISLPMQSSLFLKGSGYLDVYDSWGKFMAISSRIHQIPRLPTLKTLEGETKLNIPVCDRVGIRHTTALSCAYLVILA